MSKTITYFNGMGKNYLSSTSAPASSKEDFNPSASSLATPSLTGEGAPSTNSLASFKPRPEGGEIYVFVMAMGRV